jgi:hypothetical protein
MIIRLKLNNVLRAFQNGPEEDATRLFRQSLRNVKSFETNPNRIRGAATHPSDVKIERVHAYIEDFART